jgi:hypothetical protein
VILFLFAACLSHGVRAIRDEVRDARTTRATRSLESLAQSPSQPPSRSLSQRPSPPTAAPPAPAGSQMDDPESTLTAQFGHCAQELMNLLLHGRAVSNVFDGDVPMGDSGLTLHGIREPRPAVGYLTHLEALRYCKVGERHSITRG